MRSEFSNPFRPRTQIGISRQHLNRVFKSHLGVSVKKFNEIVLFRHTINKKLFENSDNNFTELAYEFNFNDQSHFNKMYKMTKMDIIKNT